jgi:TolB-like protein
MLIATILFVLSSCATTTMERSEQPSLLYVDGTVQSVTENQAILELKLPEFKKAPEPSISDIAQQVVQKSLFLEGIATDVNGTAAIIQEVKGKNISVVFEKPTPYPAGTAVKIRIPKKILAVVDFEVIRGNEQAVGRVTLEELTSALIESGHFTIVERSKLKTVINELELSLSGLARQTSDKAIGNLLTADLILTGTLADLGNTWDVNLRLVNVRTGQAMASIAMRTALIKPLEMRDSGPLNERFNEETLDPSWRLGFREEELYGEGGGGSELGHHCKFVLDASQGPEDIHSALKIDYDFAGIKSWTLCNASNHKRRDLSLYSGIEFYAKATQPLTGRINVVTSLPDDPDKLDSWIATFRAGAEWKRYRISFSNLTVARGWVKGRAAKFGAKPGDQIFRPNRIERVAVQVESSHNLPDIQGSLWVGKMRFYRD